MLNVFDSDAFSMVNLTAAINKLPYSPMKLGSMNLFRPKPITTTTAVVEEQHGKLYLLPTEARGTMPTFDSSRTRQARSFRVPHIPANDVVMADDVQGVRAFGSETQLQTVSQLVNEKQEALRQSHEVTWEYHRVGAVKGTILDADGTSVIYNLFTEFGLTQSEVEFDFTDADLDIKLLALLIERLIETALGGTVFTGIYAVCGNDFFDNFISHNTVATAFERWQENSFARQGIQRYDFEYAGITWTNYRGSIGAVDFVDSEEAHFFPLGVPDLFQQIMAPANFEETVNTMGKPIYSKMEKMRFGLGQEIHTQSNPLFICNRPQCLIKGTGVYAS